MVTLPLSRLFHARAYFITPINLSAAPEMVPCASCGNPDARQLCSGCRAACYCDKKCQRDHWPQHKKPCRAVTSPAAPLAAAPLRVVVFAEMGGAGNLRVVTDESTIDFRMSPCMYAGGDELAHIAAGKDGEPYLVAGLVKGAKAFVVGRRWREYITCVPLVCATREEAVARAARLRAPGELQIIEVEVE